MFRIFLQKLPQTRALGGTHQLRFYHSQENSFNKQQSTSANQDAQPNSEKNKSDHGSDKSSWKSSWDSYKFTTFIFQVVLSGGTIKLLSDQQKLFQGQQELEEKKKALDEILRRAETDQSLIYKFILNGDQDTVRKLIEEQGYDVNETNKHGRTVLHIAATCSDERILEIIVKNGAKLDAIDRNGFTPLHRAVFKGNIKAAKYIVTHCIEKHANIHCLSLADKTGYTPLHMAAYMGWTEIVEILCEALAKYDKMSISKKDKHGLTAYDYAHQCGYDDITTILRKHGACEAWENELHPIIIRVEDYGRGYSNLKLEGMDFNLPDKRGWTALHHAANAGKVDFLKMVLKEKNRNKIDINARIHRNIVDAVCEIYEQNVGSKVCRYSRLLVENLWHILISLITISFINM